MQRWAGPIGPESFYEASDSELSLPAGHLRGQYRAVFTSEFGAAWPILEEVLLESR